MSARRVGSPSSTRHRVRWSAPKRRVSPLALPRLSLARHLVQQLVQRRPAAAAPCTRAASVRDVLRSARAGRDGRPDGLLLGPSLDRMRSGADRQGCRLRRSPWSVMRVSPSTNAIEPDPACCRPQPRQRLQDRAVAQWLRPTSNLYCWENRRPRRRPRVQRESRRLARAFSSMSDLPQTTTHARAGMIVGIAGGLAAVAALVACSPLCSDRRRV